MKYSIRIGLLVVIAVLGYLTFESIAEPIRYQKQVAIKEKAVTEKLSILRDGQLAYRENKGGFASNFTDLLDFMQNGHETLQNWCVWDAVRRFIFLLCLF